MSEISIKGRARILGDDINTDYIISSRRKRDSLDPQVLRAYLLETLDPEFAASVAPGDLLVAGKNFGCGSAMEVAATVVLGAGIHAVLAKSFSRAYFRNAVNNGFPVVECSGITGHVSNGDELEILLREGIIHNLTTGEKFDFIPLPRFAFDIAEAGGLLESIRETV